MNLGKDGPSNSIGDVPNVGSPLQPGCAVLPRGDTEMLMKVIILSVNNPAIILWFLAYLPFLLFPPHSSFCHCCLAN